MDLLNGQIVFFTKDLAPVLELQRENGDLEQVSFTEGTDGRYHRRKYWVASPQLPAAGDWQFRIRLSSGRFVSPEFEDFFSTPLRRLWIQDGELFDYPPAKHSQPSQVQRIDGFLGSLPSRPIYVYLPRGYDAHTQKFYPVIYMHDGQNVFETFVEDSFAGSWQADLVADKLIRQGQIPECIIVGVGHGEADRLVEYLPPYSTLRVPKPTGKLTQKNIFDVGRADKTAVYYQDEIAPFIIDRYRVKKGRRYTGMCGSSMGGLFSLYMAWEYPQFAQHYGVMSPSLWITKNGSGKFEAIERLKLTPAPDVRIWLDSGTFASAGHGDDGQVEAVLASEVLLENGFVDGENIKHYLDKGADHSEAAWAARLDKVLRFLLPMEIKHE